MSDARLDTARQAYRRAKQAQAALAEAQKAAEANEAARALKLKATAEEALKRRAAQVQYPDTNLC
jgi:hypothetical protein